MAVRNGPQNAADEADELLGESIARKLALIEELQVELKLEQQAAGHLERASRELDGKPVPA